MSIPLSRNIFGLLHGRSSTSDRSNPPMPGSENRVATGRPSQRRQAGRAASLILACVVVAGLATPVANADAVYGNYLVGGRIEQEYLARGGPNVVGNPTSPESNANGGKFQTFQNNASIYWNANVAGGFAKLVGGLIRDRWGQVNWENGFLGYPTTSEGTLSNQNGRFNHFQGGSIYYTAATGAQIVAGAIRDTWAAAGWENSSYGYPVSEEYPLNGGYQQEFQNGLISWNVGPNPDGDPNGTNALVGADDPFNRFPRRAADPMPTTSGCSTPDADGDVICVGVGKAAPQPTVNPSPARSAPQGSVPQESVPTTEIAPPVTSDPAAPSSTITIPTSSSAPPSTTVDATLPLCPQPEVSAAPVTPTTSSEPTTTQPCSPQPAALTDPSTEASPTTTTTGQQAAPQNRPYPAKAPFRAQTVTVPADPPRNLTAETAFYKSGGACAGAALHNYFGKRFYLCGTTTYEVTMYKIDPRSATPLQLTGSEKGFQYLEGKANESGKSQTIDYRTRIARAVSSGDVLSNAAIYKVGVGGSQDRTGTITPAADVPRTVPLTAGAQTLSWQVTSNLPKGAGATQRSERDTAQGTLTFSNPRYEQSPTNVLLNNDIIFPAARCDNFQYIYVNDPGCVMAPSATRRNLPVMDLTTTRNLPTPSEATQLWDHVLTAQNSGVPGQPVALAAITGAGVALQRIPSADQAGESGRPARQNRRTACSRRTTYRPAPGFGGVANWECDEYPFASTYQGARLEPNNGRTRDWCFIKNLPINVGLSPGGWSACYIPKDMNQAGGQLIAPFNRENRILLRADDARDGYFVSAYH